MRKRVCARRIQESLTIADPKTTSSSTATSRLRSTAKAADDHTLLGLIANNFVRVYHPVVETYEVAHYTPKTKAGTGAKGETCESGYAYNKTLALCVETPKSGYTFHESELLDAKACNTYQSQVETYLGKGECEYTDNGLFSCDAPNSSEALQEPTIYAAMLAVKHGVIVDNFSCGESNKGALKVFGAVAGLFTNGYSGANYEGKFHGYPYNANYDNRLEAEEPPALPQPDPGRLVRAAPDDRAESLAEVPRGRASSLDAPTGGHELLMQATTVLSNHEVQSSLSHLAPEARSIAGQRCAATSDHESRRRVRRPGWVRDAVVRVLADHGGPMLVHASPCGSRGVAWRDSLVGLGQLGALLPFRWLLAALRSGSAGTVRLGERRVDQPKVGPMSCSVAGAIVTVTSLL